MLNRIDQKTAAPIESYLEIPSSKSPALSFDGSVMAFLCDSSGFNQIWLRSMTDGTVRQLTEMDEPIGTLAFSPVSLDLVFTTDCGGDERHQFWLLQAGHETPVALTDDPTSVHIWGCWSPDGLKLAYGCNARDRRHIDILVMSLADRSSSMVLKAERFRESLAFLPDGERILVRDARRSLSDQDLYLLNISTGAYDPLLPHEGYARYLNPRMAADGFYLLTDQDSEYLGISLYTLSSGNLTSCIQFEGSDIQALALSPDKTNLAYAVNAEGWSILRVHNLTTGKDEAIGDYPPGVIDSIVWTKDGLSLIFSQEGAATPADIRRHDLGPAASTILTRQHDFPLDISGFIEPEVQRVKSFDDVAVPFFVYRPAVPAPENGYPAVIVVHGGPEMQWTPTFRADIQFLLAQGIMVIAPNVRGSTGYGSTYCHLDDRELRMDSVADLKAVRLWMRGHADINDARVAVFGRSYGGFMVLSAMTEYPDLWQCGVEFYGIANFRTLLQTTGPWRSYLRAAEYGDVDTMGDALDRFSPIHRIDRISAPLMIVQGMDDPRVPPGESEMVFSCLRGLGRPVTYLRIPHAGHGFTRIEHKREVFGALADFLAKNL